MSRPTTSSQHSLPPHRRWIAAWLAGVVWLLGVFAAAPHWHAELHHDCGHEPTAPAALPHDHACAITWFSVGVEPLGDLPVAPAPVRTVVVDTAATPARPHGSSGEHRLPPACGPPAC